MRTFEEIYREQSTRLDEYTQRLNKREKGQRTWLVSYINHKGNRTTGQIYSNDGQTRNMTYIDGSWKKQ